MRRARIRHRAAACRARRHGCACVLARCAVPEVAGLEWPGDLSDLLLRTGAAARGTRPAGRRRGRQHRGRHSRHLAGIAVRALWFRRGWRRTGRHPQGPRQGCAVPDRADAAGAGRRSRPRARRDLRAGAGRARRPVRPRGRETPMLGVSADAAHAGFRLWAPTAQAVALVPPRRRHGPGERAWRHCSAMPRPAYGPRRIAGRLCGRSTTPTWSTCSCPASASCATASPIPYSISLTTDSQRSYIADLDDAALKPPGWDDAPRAAPLAAQTDMVDLRTARARLLRRRRQRAARRTAASTSPSPTPTRTACATCARWREAGLTDVHLLPVFDLATVPEAGCVTPAVPDAAPRQRGAAGRGDGAGRARLLQLGLRPVPLQRARRQLRQRRRRRRGAHPRVPRDGAWRCTRAGLRVGMDVVYNHTTASGQARALGARPHRARLLPPPGCERQGRALDLLRQHRHRARDDGAS